MDKYKKCEICDLSFHKQSGKFTIHLKNEHNIELKDYIIKYELNNITPKCMCGFCDEDAPFIRGIFLNRISEHQKYKWIQKQYIKNNDKPKCITCGNDVKFKRGKPNKYCSFKCLPNNWNQTKIKETVKNKYNIDVISKLDYIKEKISKKNKQNYLLNKTEIYNKFQKTCIDRYGEIPMRLDYFKNKQKLSMLNKYGVEHPSQLKKNRNKSSLRMIDNNSLYTFKEYYRIKKYKKTSLYYQSSYEYDFLKHCENKNILDIISNGNVYYKTNNKRMLTDFFINNFNTEIEIKSTYILNKQGGYDSLNDKRNTVEKNGKKYIIILDKNYNEFNDILNIK